LFEDTGMMAYGELINVGQQAYMGGGRSRYQRINWHFTLVIDYHSALF